MKAGQIVERLPTVAVGDPVAGAVRVMQAAHLPGLIVLDAAGQLATVLPGTQVLRLAVPRIHQEDPRLSRIIDEAHADMFWRELGGVTVGSCLPRQPAKVALAAVVGPDATVLEVAALMARLHCPLVAVRERGGTLLGGITLDRLLSALAVSDPGT